MSKIQKAVSIVKNKGVFEMMPGTIQHVISSIISSIEKAEYKIQASRTEKNTITTNYSEANFSIDSWNEYRVTHDGISEQVLIDDIIERAHDSDVLYDIGAAIGTHSCLIAPHIGKTIAFEPYPRTLQKRKRMLK